jgi:D-lactate dehydrogenase (cytochrome)
MRDESGIEAALLASLAQAVGAENLVVDLAERRFYSTDLYSQGEICAAAVRPQDSAALARAVGLATGAGYAVVPRGGGLTYVGGYTPTRAKTITIDVAGLNRIVEISAADMFITVEAGVTWKQIYDALKPLGLRLPFFGTFSGAQATVGGGLSNGALFLGTARYGSAAEIVLGLEVALADGALVRTGQAGVVGAKPFFRAYGPDLTGLFVHDAGALGVKTQATLRMIRAPGETGYLSFGFESANAAIAAACEIARSELAEEANIMDPAKTRLALGGGSVSSDVAVLAAVSREAGGGVKGLVAAAEVARAGKHFADDVHSLNLVCAARSRSALEADMVEAERISFGFGGRRLPDSIPRANRANLFPPLNGVLGPQGERWVALNAKVAHSDAQALYDAAEAVLARRAREMEKAGVRVSRLLTMMSNHAFSYEPVFTWLDAWLPQHRRAPEPRHLARFSEPAANPVALALVDSLRAELVELFARFGAASNQIGKTYRYLSSLHPETRALVRSLKTIVDPHGLMNPGALGLPGGA